MGRPSRYPDEFRREAVQMALASNTSWAGCRSPLGGERDHPSELGARPSGGAGASR
jgi:hypothetical protein